MGGLGVLIRECLVAFNALVPSTNYMRSMQEGRVFVVYLL